MLEKRYVILNLHGRAIKLTIYVRHYSYECKATVQERPYISRPSRTQQFLNPKLAPKLNNDVPNDLARKQGIADEQLAKLEEERGRNKERRSASPQATASQPRKRSRSISSHSSDSVSTISTNRSVSPKRPRRRGRESHTAEQDQPFLDYEPRSTKRRYSSSDQSRSRSWSVTSDRYAGPSDRRRDSDANQRRRHQLASPDHRGRHESHRRGSRRTRSRSSGLDKSRIAKGRKSMTPAPEMAIDDDHEDQKYERDNRQDHSRRADRMGNNRPPIRKERSLSPYSKRLALTQAMNLG